MDSAQNSCFSVTAHDAFRRQLVQKRDFLARPLHFSSGRPRTSHVAGGPQAHSRNAKHPSHGHHGSPMHSKTRSRSTRSTSATRSVIKRRISRTTLALSALAKSRACSADASAAIGCLPAPCPAIVSVLLLQLTDSRQRSRSHGLAMRRRRKWHRFKAVRSRFIVSTTNGAEIPQLRPRNALAPALPTRSAGLLRFA